MIKEFIKENNISFKEGERNSSVVTLIGYSQARGLKEVDLRKELFDEIEADPFIKNEIQRLWNYCERNKYKDFWLKPEAKKLYKF